MASAAENAPAGKVAVRIWAWALGGLSFLAPLGILGLSPKPVQAQGGATPAAQAAKPKRPVVIIITRKRIIQDAPKPSVTSSGGGGVSYVYAPSAAAPVAASCGTHPC